MVFFFFDKAVVQAFKSQQELFWDSFDFVDINDNIFVKINSIKALMNNGKFMLLNKVMDKLKNTFDLERNDSDGTKLCDAKFDKKGIVEGKAKIFNYEGILIFDGEFVDHQRNGQGVEYLSNRIKTKEGTWKDGKLIDGIIYDVLLEDEDNLFLDEIHFLADNRHLFSEIDNDLLVGHLKVKNEDYHIMENSLKNAAEVIDNYYNKF